jgi:hypothetical protein
LYLIPVHRQLSPILRCPRHLPHLRRVHRCIQNMAILLSFAFSVSLTTFLGQSFHAVKIRYNNCQRVIYPFLCPLVRIECSFFGPFVFIKKI